MCGSTVIVTNQLASHRDDRKFIYEWHYDLYCSTISPEIAPSREGHNSRRWIEIPVAARIQKADISIENSYISEEDRWDAKLFHRAVADLYSVINDIDLINFNGSLVSRVNTDTKLRGCTPAITERYLRHLRLIKSF